MKQAFVLATAVVLAVLAGCRNPPSSGVTVESYPQNKIAVNSRVVGGWLKVMEVNAAMRNDLLQAQVIAQNDTQKDCQFEYRFEWRNKDGMEISTSTAVWIPVNISAKEKKAMVSMAPNKEASEFVFVVRFRRPSLRWTR